MPRGLRLAVAVVAVLLLAGAAETVAKSVNRAPRFHHRAMSAQQIRRAARANRIIVVLKSQQRGRLATAASVRARASTQRAQRRPLIASINRSGGAVTRQFTVLNAFAAQVSDAEKARLASDPSVASVVPDALVTESQPDTVGQTGGGGSPGTGNPTTPQSGICPSDPAKPLLEPEALQTMHVASNDSNTPEAQDLATGKGVKVAFFADGLDINNPDFIRPDGSHVFIDYRDFTGEGPNAPTGAAEAFGDASSIAAQGRQVYDIANFVNPAHPLPPGCTITVRGVAPGASLIGMKVFGAVSSAYVSVIIQGMDWAVTQDHADIISESFGDHTLPDTARDTIKQFNDAAVNSGVTVSQGTCDCGATGTPSSPATDSLVLDSGGNTNFQNYAQTTSYAMQFSNGTWLNDNISSIAGGGFAQNASSPDFVTPAEANWALCSPNPGIYLECTDFKGAPAQLQQFGGVSQSTPFTAGIAALMIEAYRNTHGGQTPSPALVKQILQSTANDLGFPNEEQGAGELDALKAVQEAISVNGGTPTGHGLLFDPAKLTIVKPAGSSDDETVSVTNSGATTQTVSAHSRALTQAVSDNKQDVNLGTAPTFIDQFGAARPYVTTTFTVPANVDRLVAYDAWPGPAARVGLTLIDPTGAYAAYTRPQGDGDHTQVDVRNPVAGKWTAIVFKRDGTYTGVVHLEFVTQRFGGVDSVSPSSLTLRPGQTGRFHLHTQLPGSPGDSAHDLVISDSSGDQTVVPVVLRSLVPVDGHGGTFSGTIIGGNGREFIEQQNTFSFDVPPGRQVLSASLTFPDDPNTELIGTLVDPDGNLLGSQSTRYSSFNPNTPDTFTHGLRAITLDPKPGRWTFVVNVANPVGGQTLSAPYRGAISFDPPRISVRGLPSGDKVKAGQPITATVTVHNDGPGTEDVFADPRLNSSETDSVFPISNNTVPLPIPGDEPAPTFLVPTQVNGVLGVAQANRPILLEMGFGVIGEGDPDLLGTSQGNNAAAFYSADEVANGPWFEAPAMRGPFDSAQSGTVTTGLLVNAQAFDHNADSSTGDIWRQTVDANAPDYTPLTLAPGRSGRITVTFTPQGTRGSKVKGTLYVDDFGLRLLTGNEEAAFPYSYKIK
ncbi:MAG: S8 family peptidase [Solirubrobacteraceae bacterium]